ncbi:hypothetical protein Tco_0865845, partial [Tanacetum coccineum]
KAKKNVKLMMEKLFGMELELMLLHALVDGKKVIISEASVRRDLKLEDEEGVDCLPNSTIFEQLTLMGQQIRRIGKQVSGTQTANLQNSDTHENNDWRIYVRDRLGSRDVHSRLGQWRSPSKSPPSSTIPTDPYHTPTIIQPSTSQPQKTQKPSKLKRKNTQVPQPSGLIEHVAYEVVHKELGDSLVRAATTASSLEVEQDSGNITKTRSKAIPNESSTTATTFTITTEEVTLAHALADLKSTKPKAKGIAFREPELKKPLKKKDQLKLDKEIVLKLQAEIDEEERIPRAKEEKIDEANIAWDDIQAKVDAYYQLAERLQAEEPEQFTIKEKATLFK